MTGVLTENDTFNINNVLEMEVVSGNNANSLIGVRCSLTTRKYLSFNYRFLDNVCPLSDKTRCAYEQVGRIPIESDLIVLKCIGTLWNIFEINETKEVKYDDHPDWEGRGYDYILTNLWCTETFDKGKYKRTEDGNCYHVW